MNRIIELEHVSLAYRMRQQSGRYKKLIAVNDVSFSVIKGQMLSLVGFNGAGKTTTLSLISGILRPDRGIVNVMGRVVPFLGLGIGFNPELTGRENVYLYGAIMGMRRYQINALYDSIVDFSELREFMDMKIKEYSSGMYIRLGFSVAIHTQPDILIIDEVLAVGDYAFQKKCLDKIMQLKRDGVTVLFVSHNLGLVMRFSDRVIHMHEGKIAGDGEPEPVVKAFMNMKNDIPSVSGARRGSGEVLYSGYELLDEMPKDKLRIKIEYENRGGIERAVPGFSIYSQNGDLVAGPNMLDCTGNMLMLEKRGEMLVETDISMLNPGIYYISLGLYDKNNRFPYDHIDYAMSFTISGEKKDYLGPVSLPVEWNI